MSVPLQDAATIVLLRDGSHGLQVLMARRSSHTRFSAGAYVFPGGAVDPADTPAIDFCHGLNAVECNARFGEDQALRYYLAAARELYEEVGVWLFGGNPPADPDLRRALHAGEITIDAVLRARVDAFDCRALHYFSFWTTPPVMPRRYRTRFFAALMPPGQRAEVDGIELTRLCWIEPETMLERQRAGEVELIFPTIKELQRLSRYATAERAWQAIRRVGEVPEIRTRHRVRDGRSVDILMPGDAGYDDLPAW